MSERSGSVQTVLGPISPSNLGHTQLHEHVIIDLVSTWEHRAKEFDDVTLARAKEEITLANLSWISKNWSSHRLSNRLEDEDHAIEELNDYWDLGGRTLVDATPEGIGRNPDALRRIAIETGLQLIMGSGFYLEVTHPDFARQLSIEELANVIVNEFKFGVGDSGIKPGIIGEIGLAYPVHPREEIVLRAAIRAQIATGAALLIHPGRDPRAPKEALAIVEEENGDISRTIMSHIDRTLFTLESMIEVAKTGCILEFDLFGQESSYYPIAPIDLPNDGTRIDYIQELIGKGYLNNLVISQDIGNKIHLKKYGGNGYGHILESVLPLMERKGLTHEEIRALVDRNPTRLLTFV